METDLPHCVSAHGQSADPVKQKPVAAEKLNALISFDRSVSENEPALPGGRISRARGGNL